MASFATHDELATFLRRSFTSQENSAADLILAGVTSAIKRHTGQDIELVTNDDVKLYGSWSRELELPKWPVVSVSSVKINGNTVAAGTWLLAGRKLYRGNLPIFNGPTDWGGDLYLSSWLGPMATVEVVYTHGFNPIPDDIKLICLRAAGRAFDNPEGLTSESTGSVGVNASGDGSGLLTDAEKAALDALIPHV